MSEQYPDALMRAHASERQLEFLDALAEHGTAAAANRALGLAHGVVSRSMRRLRKRVSECEVHPHRDPDHIADGQRIKGVSATQYVLDPESGKYRMLWIKTERDPLGESIQAACDAALTIEGLARELPEHTQEPSADLLNCLPIGDPHFGLYAWGAETGQQDFDLRTAERQWRDMIDRAVAVMPYTERGVLIQLGDLTHGNDHRNVTPQSGHTLDVDTRHQLVMRAAARSMYYAAERMRERCGHLHVEMVPGNHSPETVMALTIALDAYFRHADDVHISMNPRDIRLVAEWGDVLITTSHGDKQKPETLGSLIPAQYAQAWGRTTKRYHHGGHVHHTHRKDIGGLVFESHRSPAPMDAYAAAKFWSEQSTEVIVYHRTRGEHERHTIGIR